MKKKLHIDMETVSVHGVRYKSADDWYDPKVKGNNVYMKVKTVDFKNTDYDFLVLIHALVEAYLCFRRGIKDKDVCEFDKKHIDHENPGDLEDAPYHEEHQTATDIEAILANELQINWVTYEETLEKVLEEKWSKK